MLSRLFGPSGSQRSGNPDVFDAAFYVAAYADVLTSGVEPAKHWRSIGKKQGRIGALPESFKPFDPDYYLSLYPDIGLAGVNPYEHWIRHGKAEGRSGDRPRPLAEGVPHTIREAITRAGLFDQAFYLSCYREVLGAAVDPLDHFISLGQHKGFKPNVRFDPLIYLLRNPDARPSAVLHYLDQLDKGGPAALDLSTYSAFTSLKLPDFAPYIAPPPDLVERDLQADLNHSQRFGEAQAVEFEIDREHYRLVSPSAEEFFGRIESGSPFSFPRLPHGFWDCLAELDNMRAGIAAAVPQGVFTEAQISRLAERFCDETMTGWGVYAEHFLPELLVGIRSERTSPDNLRSVSFKWRPTMDDRVFGRTEEIGEGERRQFRTFDRYFGPGHELYESTLWKRWAYSGDLKRLPPIARKRPIVLMGMAWVGDLDQRWGLPWFEHVEIPASSYTIRYEVLDRLKAATLRAKETAARNSTRPPLVLLQGGSFAYWLIARLHAWDPSVFYLDLGQSLHIWFLDNKELWLHWLLFHPRLVMENGDLDTFYRERGIVLEPPFAPT